MSREVTKADMGKAAASDGISLATLLTVLFVGLKLTGHIGWSWWWVLSPTWIPLALALVVLFIGLVVVEIRDFCR